MIDKGALFCWYFHFMPVGRAATAELMPTPEQREKMYRFIREMREKKPLFTLDFQNDGEFVGGCIAGGRRYLHINAAGDVEPCVFIHYSNANIHDVSLLDALRSPHLHEVLRRTCPSTTTTSNHAPCSRIPTRYLSSLPRAVPMSTDLVEKETPEQLREKTVEAAAEGLGTRRRPPVERLRRARCTRSAMWQITRRVWPLRT